MGRKIVFAFFVVVSLFTQSTQAQSFFYRENSDQGESSLKHLALDFSVDESWAIQFQKPELFSKFLTSGEKVSSEKIQRRALTKAEEAVTTSLWILTGFLILATTDAYDLGGGLKLLSRRGLIFFILPFESHSIFRTCGGKEYLVATSDKPEGETLQGMKPLDELRELCDPKTDEQPTEGQSS